MRSTCWRDCTRQGYQLDRSGSLGDEMRTDQLLPLRDRKADIATKRSLCAAAIGSIIRFSHAYWTLTGQTDLVAS
jgi:hypothetical protein